MTVLGLGGLLKDSAAAILRDGEIVAAIEQQRVARRDVRRELLPEEAIRGCLEISRIRSDQVDCVALARPIPERPGASLYLNLRNAFPNSQIMLVEHHAAHAAAAYFPSPFDVATVLTLDRAGDFRCGALWNASGNKLSVTRELYYPDSLGDLFGRVADFIGFEPSAEEHKVQWLSTHGDDRFVPLFRDILGTGWPRLDRTFFVADRASAGGFAPKFYERLGVPDGSEPPEGLRAHIAAGIQRAAEATVLEMIGTGENLCLGGGLALNALLVAAIEKSQRYKNVFVQPAAGNAGTAIGAAAHAASAAGEPRPRVGDLCYGPSFSAEQIKQVLENCKLRFRYLLTTDELIDAAVEQIAGDRIVAWMQSRMEFGPRALGNRSILASPLDPYSTENLNIYIKHRETFRKFAASVPAEDAAEYFEVGSNARFLATTGTVKQKHRKLFDAATMGDGLVRVHTVAEKDNPLFWRLLKRFGQKTGVPVLFNTSFNLFGDPLVCTPRDAVRSFYSSGIDAMFVGHFLLEK
jgi:carbamoyltransferase